MTRFILIVSVSAIVAMAIGGAFGRAVYEAEHMESVR